MISISRQYDDLLVTSNRFLGALFAEHKELDLSAPNGMLLVPKKVTLPEDKSGLRWQTVPAGRKRAYGRELLVEFCRLSKADGRRILAFATRYGPLGIAATEFLGNILDEEPNDTWFRQETEFEFWESLVVWRQISELAQVFLGLYSKVLEDRSTRASDWVALYRESGGELFRYEGLKTQKQMNALSGWLNLWLHVGEVRPFLSMPSPDKREISLECRPPLARGFSQLFGQLGRSTDAVRSRYFGPNRLHILREGVSSETQTSRRSPTLLPRSQRWPCPSRRLSRLPRAPETGAKEEAEELMPGRMCRAGRTDGRP